MPIEGYCETSIARRLITRMQASHEQRRISVFAGPPGIGKTTAIAAFCDRHPNDVAVVRIARRNAREVLALQHLLEAVRLLSKNPRYCFPTSTWDLRRLLFLALCDRIGVKPDTAQLEDIDPERIGRLTIVFDEAQNLSRGAIELLRFWNDSDRCYSPFPIGLIFVGNSEFALASNSAGDSVISAAVADRALYFQTFEYSELTDADLTLVIEAKGVTDRDVVAAILQVFGAKNAIRSLRRLNDFLAELAGISGGSQITAQTVQQAVGF